MSYTDQVKSACRFDTSRPVIIAGNGPSLLDLDGRQLPADAYVFRCNWFFLEDHYRLGRRVDAYFWSIHNEGMLRGVEEAVRIGGYEIGSFFSPVSFTEFGDDASMCSKSSFTPCHNPWRIIAGQQDMAATMMMRPLPTQGMQMLATALEMGFTDISLVGIDFYQSTSCRYAFPVAPAIAEKWLLAKDLTPGYEQNHSMAVDLRILQYGLDAYPNAKIRNLGVDNPLLPKCGRLLGESSGWFEEKVSAAHLEARALSKKLILKDAPAGLRCAFVTYADDKFAFGVAALANSLRQVSDVPLIVMVPAQVDLGLVPKLENIRIHHVNKIDNPNELKPYQQRFQDTYSKLNVFGLPFLDRAIFLDADTLVLKNIDHLFEQTGFAAAPDFGMLHNRETFNSGVFVCSPSARLYADILKNLRRLPSYDGGDQGFLNLFFADSTRLDWRYNALKRVSVEYSAIFQLEEISVLHFVGQKPWNLIKPPKERNFKFLTNLWFSMLPDDSKIALLHAFRAESLEWGGSGGGPRLRVELKHFEQDGEIPERIKAMEAIELKPLEMAKVLVSIGRADMARAISEACLKKNPSSSAHRQILDTCDKMPGGQALKGADQRKF